MLYKNPMNDIYTKTATYVRSAQSGTLFIFFFFFFLEYSTCFIKGLQLDIFL